MRLLRLRDFRLLVMSNGLSAMGDELALIALTIKAFDVSGRSGMAVAAVLLAGIVPLVAFAPLAGLIVDRTETTGTLAIASAIQAAIALGLAFAHPLWLIVALCFALGCVASVASPAVLAIVPVTVEESDLTAANANMETARYAGMIVGPILAVAFAKGALVVDAVTFLAICSAAASLSVRRPPEPAPEGSKTKGEARQGFRFIGRDRVLLIAVATIACAVFFGTIDSVAEVFFARDPTLLNAGVWGYGALASAWLVGMVIGAGFVARRLADERLAVAVVLSSVVGGAAVLTAAGFATIGIALTMFVLGGIANGVAGVSIRSLIHHRVPGDLRGRVFAAFFGLAFAGQVAATGLGGLLLGILPSAKYVLFVGGLGSMVTGLLALAWLAVLSEARRTAGVVVVPEAEVVVVPEAEPVRASATLIREITPVEDAALDPVEVLPSGRPSS